MSTESTMTTIYGSWQTPLSINEYINTINTFPTSQLYQIYKENKLLITNEKTLYLKAKSNTLDYLSCLVANIYVALGLSF